MMLSHQTLNDFSQASRLARECTAQYGVALDFHCFMVKNSQIDEFLEMDGVCLFLTEEA